MIELNSNLASAKTASVLGTPHRGGSSRKNLGGPWPRGQGRERGSGGEAPANFFDHALFVLRKRPILAQILATCTRKAVKMKEQK